MLTLFILSFGILSRIVVHTPNFTPVLALALFGGMYLKGRQGIWVPLVLMAISDVVLGWHDTMVYTWGSILLISLMGLWLKEHKSWVNVALGSLLSSVVFFVITNFGAYLSLYPHTLAGLQECYIAAIPFYRSTLVSTLAYSLVLFSIWEILLSRRENPFLMKML
ncbi:MAG: hypothetical protein HQL15_00795 [Candidatus Omnitrophica bacterium]|nr:hypothetical protein [Candidatus Omnitrophota bacterium]